MAAVYEYPGNFPESIQEYIARITQDETPAGGSAHRRRKNPSSWDIAIEEAGACFEEVYDAFVAQMGSTVATRLAKEAVYHTALFGGKLFLYLVLRIGQDAGMRGCF